MFNFDSINLMSLRDEMPVPSFNWQGKKIMIVEDDYVNYLYFHEILSCAHACLIRAVSLQEAFDMLTSGNYFDLLIINTGMPGNENCRSIKRLKLLWPNLPLIALSDCGCKFKNKRCNPVGCDTMISHNIDSNNLRMVVNEMFHPVN